MGVASGAGAGGEDIGCEACVVSHLRPTDFSAILASRSGAPVASDAGGPRWQSRRRAERRAPARPALDRWWTPPPARLVDGRG